METMLSTIGTVVPVVGLKGSEVKPVIELEKLEHTLSDKALETGRVRAIGVGNNCIKSIRHISKRRNMALRRWSR